MSDYKIVNGKKVRVCKYGCETELVWSDDISGFIETEGKLPHTKERCQEVKSKQTNSTREAKFDEIIKKLVAIGIELEALKKQ